MASSSQKLRYSLWLVPPESSALSKSVSKIINEALPPIFPEVLLPNFGPHVTLKGNPVLEPASDPQVWLDALQLPDLDGLCISVGELHVGNSVFNKLSQLCKKTPELCRLAAICRSAGTGAAYETERGWVEQNWKPHVSLIYSDLERDEVLSKLGSVKDTIQDVKRTNGPDCLTAHGAVIWVIPSFKDVSEWIPVARRKLGQGVEWKWEI